MLPELEVSPLKVVRASPTRSSSLAVPSPSARLSALGVWRFGMMDLGASKSWRLKAELDWRRARVAADLD